MKRGSRESISINISSNRISSRYTDSAAHSRAILSGKDIFHYGYHHDRRSPSHTLSASEYHCCIELSSELWAAASLPPPLQTDLFVAAAVASLSFLLSFSSRLHFRRSRLRTEPRKTLSLSPSLFAHSNKQSVIMGREEREGKTCRTANPTLAPLRWHIHTLTGEADKIEKATAADSWCLVEKCRGMSALIVCTALPPVDNTPRKINDAHRRRTWDACLRE